MTRRICLAVARLASAMWVGAGFLFVATSVTEQVQPSFDAATKDTLALIRFPWYYGTGGTLLIVACAGAAWSRLAIRPRAAAVLLLLGAAVLLNADWAFVYRPMREALTPPGARRGAEFELLHTWSEWLNGAGFVLNAAAAVILCASRERTGPVPPPAGETDA